MDFLAKTRMMAQGRATKNKMIMHKLSIALKKMSSAYEEYKKEYTERCVDLAHMPMRFDPNAISYTDLLSATRIVANVVANVVE